MTSSVYTADARFVLTGSDDGNVRIWKARASEKLGIITTREKAAMEYRDSLRARWSMDPGVGKVARYVPSFFFLPSYHESFPDDCDWLYSCRSRRIPKPVYKASQLKHTMLEAQRVKEERRRKHTRAGEAKPKAEKKRVVITEQS